MSAVEKLSPVSFMPTGLTYGPFQSSVFGTALGINLLGEKAKVCSLNCAYCDLGVTEARLNRLKDPGSLPSKSEIVDAVTTALREIHERGPAIDSIIVSGNGEPTLHPDFADIVTALIELRNTWLPKKPIVIYTSGVTLDQRKISEAVNKLEERIVKIDAGNERVFKNLNAPLARVNLAKVLSGIESLDSVTVQAMFCQGTVDNTLTADIDDWIEVIALLKPKAVHIQGVSNAPAVSGIVRCDEDTLHTIASRLERRTGIRAHISI